MTKTAEDIGNQFGYLCPQCKQGDCLKIHATRSVIAELYPNGTDDDGGDTEWDDESTAQCGCGWIGTVKDLLEDEEFEG